MTPSAFSTLYVFFKAAKHERACPYQSQIYEMLVYFKEQDERSIFNQNIRKISITNLKTTQRQRVNYKYSGTFSFFSFYW